MNKQLPTKEQVIFVPCDDVRQEIGNKSSFMGVYTGFDIAFPKEAPQEITFLIALVFWLIGGEGHFRYSIKVYDPNEAEVVNTPTETLDKKANEAALLAIKLPIKVSVGKYRIVLDLDGRQFEHFLNIRRLD
jgi:hypothetical protein